MIVVADTSPLNYLLQIGEIDILPVLYGSVIVPSSVRQEMLHPFAPLVVRAWADRLPTWANIRRAEPRAFFFDRKLGMGEREALTIAQQDEQSLLLIDETTGRLQARLLHIHVIGTLGILREAHEQQLLDLRDAITRLRSTTFQVSTAVLNSVLQSIE